MTSGSDASARAAAARRPHPAAIVPTLAVLLGLQPITTDLYLPALPAIQESLRGSMTQTQMTLSALLLAFGAAQLFVGPLSDRVGRRPVLLVGLLAYAIATIASALAPSIGFLVVCRALQGACLAASIVCARAIVRDLFEPAEGARVMARSLSGLGIFALTGPLAGALLAGQWGWRATFAACAVFVAVAIAIVIAWLPETLRQPSHAATRLRPLLGAWRSIAVHPAFVAWTLLIAATYGMIYSYLAGSSFLFIGVMGTTRLAYGVALSATTLAYIAGTLVCHRRLREVGLQRTVRQGALFSIAGGIALVVIAAGGWHTPVSVTLAMACLCFAHGHQQPCAQAAVIGPFPLHAGTAAALAGFVMSAAAFGIGAWLGWVMDGTALPILLTQAFLALTTATVGLTLVQRHGATGTAPHAAPHGAAPAGS